MECGFPERGERHLNPSLFLIGSKLRIDGIADRRRNGCAIGSRAPFKVARLLIRYLELHTSHVQIVHVMSTFQTDPRDSASGT